MNIEQLSEPERACYRATQKHINRVRALLDYVADELEARRRTHDQSKLQEPELSAFAEVNDKLSSLTYGSDAYEAALEELDEALAHHYAENRHHPEHFEEGLEGMHLVDVVEMFVDWKAASERHDDGDLHASIEHNAERFGYGEPLKSILHNTADWLEARDA